MGLAAVPAQVGVAVGARVVDVHAAIDAAGEQAATAPAPEKIKYYH